MFHLRRPQMALELGHQFVRPVDVFIGRDRRQEVARIGQAVRPDRTKVGVRESKFETVVMVKVILGVKLSLFRKILLEPTTKRQNKFE